MASLSRGFSGAMAGGSAGAMTGTPVGVAIGAVVGFAAGMLSGDDNSEQAAANMQKALATLDAVGIPPDLAKPLLLQHLQQAGKLSPVYEAALTSDNFTPAQIQENPQTRTDLTSGLANLKAESQGGLNPEQLAAAHELFNKVNANTQAQMKGALQSQEMQGKAGSGDTLAAQLNAQQQGAQNLTEGAGNIGAANFKAQQQALQDYISGTGNLRSQDLSKLTSNAQLQQQADMWKANNASSRQARNVASTNTANAANWNQDNAQNMYNTTLDNNELARQRAAQQQEWEDKMQLAAARANAYTGQAGFDMQQAQNSNQAWNNVTQGVTGAAGAYGQYKNNQDWINAYKDRNPSSGGGYGNLNSNPTYSNPWGNQGGGSTSNLGYNYKFAEGGMVQAPDPIIGQDEQKMADGGSIAENAHGIHNFLAGGHVPGKAQYPGNDYRNDVVPAVLSPEEIVVPNSVSHDPDAAADFVKNEIEGRQMKAAGPMFQKLHERLKKVEAKRNTKKVA